jgi:GT2 family glycosyltransferase
VRDPITIVIPTRGMAPLLALCVDQLRLSLQQAGGDGRDRIVVIDNATPDPVSRDLVRGDDIHWIRYDQHHSFSACCNAGMAAAPNPLYLMLNNDVVLHREAIAALVHCLAAHPEVGILGARLVFPNGNIQHCGVRFGNTEYFVYHEHRTVPSAQIPRVDALYQAVTGACMLIRSEVVTATGGFDEIYPFYFEDIDLCLRARLLGWQVMCCHAVDSIHFESMTAQPKELNPEAKAIFLQRWEGRWCIDG